MISDFVKGKKKFDYPVAIQNGIMLHRYIDTFTDEHEATKEAKQVFRAAYRLYSGAFVDVVYDHFLAADVNEFSQQSLLRFTEEVYFTLDNNTPWLPEPFAVLFPYMKKQNWLFNYHTRLGIYKSMGGLVKRAAFLTESDTAFHLFEQHYLLLQECYHHFWKELKPYALKQFELFQHGPESNI